MKKLLIIAAVLMSGAAAMASGSICANATKVPLFGTTTVAGSATSSSVGGK